MVLPADEHKRVDTTTLVMPDYWDEMPLFERAAEWDGRRCYEYAGRAQQLTEARVTLTGTKAELADVMEKDAMLEAEEQRAKAELRALISCSVRAKRSFPTPVSPSSRTVTVVAAARATRS